MLRNLSSHQLHLPTGPDPHHETRTSKQTMVPERDASSVTDPGAPDSDDAGAFARAGAAPNDLLL